MKVIAIGTLCFSLMLGSASAAQQSWKVTEGVKSDVNSVWVLDVKTEGTFTGKSVGNFPDNTPLTYDLTGAIINGTVLAKSSNRSDKNICTYSGSLSGTSIQGGIAQCANATVPWLADVVSP